MSDGKEMIQLEGLIFEGLVPPSKVRVEWIAYPVFKWGIDRNRPGIPLHLLFPALIKIFPGT